MRYNKHHPLRCFFAFAGYDSTMLALRRLQRQFPWFCVECVGWSEIEPNAIKAHNALFPEYADKNYGDITKIDWRAVPDFDLLTYSFPCQDISNAGLQRGFSEGSGSRSSLLWECEKAIAEKRPKYLLMENVKALVQKKFMPDFTKWLNRLDSYGYANFWKVINAKHFGCPQNRERTFCVSILRDENTPFPKYEFPQPLPLDKTVEGALIEDAEEKYFIRDKMLAKFCVLSDKNDNDAEEIDFGEC